MSTIKVDTLQTRAGSTAAVTGAGFVATDQIRGNTAANSVTVVGEGGTVTTNLQQGLNKAWINFNGTGTVAINDSFNVSGITDVGTGQTTITYSSAMANTSYSWAGSTKGTTDRAMVIVDNGNTPASASIEVDTVYDGATLFDCSIVAVQIAGDLA